MRFPARESSSCCLHRARILALFLFCLPAAHLCAAQQPATPAALTGLVRTSKGTPVPGASVRLINNETTKLWLSWTDESGKFEFPQIGPGHYRIEANQLGFVQSSLTIEVPVVPPGPIPIVLRVATLAELSAAPGNPASNKPSSRGNGQGNSQSNGQNKAQNNSQDNSQNTAQNRRGTGGTGGRGQVPAGVANAIREGLAGGFEQTDLTGEATTPQTAEGNSSSNAGSQAEATLLNGANSNATSDSFLLQGTVGQSLAANGPGGFGEGGLIPGTPGGAGQGGPGGGRGGGGGGGGQMFGPGGGGFGGPGGQGGPGGGGGMPGGGGRGRLGRQTVNRIRFSFYDHYENSAFDAKPYSITGHEVPKPSHYDERFGGNLGGPLKIPHIYNGSDKTFFSSTTSTKFNRARWTRIPRCQRPRNAAAISAEWGSLFTILFRISAGRELRWATAARFQRSTPRRPDFWRFIRSRICRARCKTTYCKPRCRSTTTL